MNDTYLYDKCPTCGHKLKETGDPIYFHCDNCGENFFIEELEFKPLQNKMDKWLK